MLAPHRANAPRSAAARRRFLKTITYQIASFPSQRRYYELRSEDRDGKKEKHYYGFSGPVGTGKTWALCNKALIMAARNPGLPGMITAPTYPMLRDVTIATMLDILAMRKIPYRYYAQRNVLHLKRNDSLILFRSMSNPERLIGSNLAWGGCDELTYCKEAAFQRLEARIRHPKATELAIFGAWTPKGYDWVYDRFIGPEKKPKHTAIIAAACENIAVLENQPDFYEDMKASYDELFYRQECLGEYLPIFAGRVYHAYAMEQNDADTVYNPHAPLDFCIDFNIDPMGGALAQHAGGKVFILEELTLGIGNTIAMCEKVYERIKETYLPQWQAANGSARQLPLWLYGDAAGESRNTKASGTDYDQIRQYFQRSDVRCNVELKVNVPKSNPRVKDRVNSVNSLLRNAHGVTRMWVDRRCKELRNDLLKVIWLNGSTDIDKKTDRKRTHWSDAVGYLVWEEFPVDSFQRAITLN